MRPAGRNAIAAIALVAGLAALVAVPAAVSARLPDEGPPLAGVQINVGYGVSLRAPVGARHVLADSRPGSGTVALRTEGVELRITAVEVRERPRDFVAHARHKFGRDGWKPGPPQEIRTAGGLVGERGDLVPVRSRADAPGCYAIFTAERVGVVVTVSPSADCAAVPAATWAAVNGLTVKSEEPA